MLDRFNHLYGKIINEEIGSEVVFKKITNAEMQRRVSTIENENPRLEGRLPDILTKFEKLGELVCWWILEKGDRILACAACSDEFHNSMFINEICSFVKGAGSKLLLRLLEFKNYDIIYLNADWTQPGLEGYYRRPEFGFEEKDVEKGGKTTCWFYKNFKLNEYELQAFSKRKFIFLS